MAKPPKMQIAIIPVTPFQQNASIVVCTQTNKAAIVDPGGDIHIFKEALIELKAIPEKIILTHGHIDHAGGAAQLAEDLNLPIIGPHQGDEKMMLNLPTSALKFGMENVRACTSSQWLNEGDEVSVGEIKFEVRHVPGHSPGSVVFINHDQHFALVGDTLFQGSIGRTDFEYGNHDELIEHIHSKLFTLADDYTILPGHGAASTIGLERKNNPFLRVN
jgi:hydroxyacylglutathione hydrolase